MKKMIFRMMAVVAVLSVGIACSKEIDNVITPEKQEQEKPENGKMTITVKLSDVQTKVSFDPVYTGENNKPVSMGHTWQAGDMLRITNANSESEIFELIDGADSSFGTFEGPHVYNGPFTVEVIPVGEDPENYFNQTQLKDGDTSHLRFVAAATDVNDLDGIVLEETSQIIGLIAKLPEDVATTVSSLEIVTSVDDFENTTTLKVSLTEQEDVDTDGFLKVYANAPAGWSIPADSKMLLRFSSVNENHTVYTRYQEFADAVELEADKFNYIRMDCSHIDQYAGKADDGTSAHPYLIADPYQVAAINGLATGGQTTYFKMITDVDMKGVTHNPINTNSGYTQAVNFDGNNKTISNLAKNFFYVFKGSAKDLTLDNSTVTARGIFAEYIQGTGHEMTNITVSNGTVSSSSANVGGLIGNINTGTSGVTSVTVTDCNVIGTNVTGGSVVGGLIGFANALVTMSGCTYSGGTVSTAGKYLGGAIGSTANEASVISDCHVEEATISSTCTDDARCGGFIGQSQTKVQIKGCTVGTESKKVVVTTAQPASGKFLNTGGFVGVNYGTITKNGDVRSKAYAKITSANTLGQQLDLGGFAGFGRGRIEYSDAIVDMSNLKGQYIGGFAGYVTNSGTVIDNCTIDGAVKGNNYTGGFAGYVDAGAPEISNCSASGSVTAQSGCGGFVGQTMTGIFTDCSTSMTCSFSGSNNGGFAGQIHGGTMTGCSSAGSVTATGGSTYGGFVGLITTNGTTLEKCFSCSNLTDEKGSYNGGFCGTIEKGTVLIKRCYASGDITSDKTYAAGFIGNIHHTSNTLNVTIQNCYATGSIIKSNQIRGGFIAQVGTVTSATISNCYASGAVVGTFRLGGLIGNVGAANINVDHCAAWNSEVTASNHGASNWSSGAVVGTAFPSCTLTDNYRKPGMPVLAYWGNVTGYTYLLADDYQHANVDASNTLIKQNGAHSTATALASGQDGYPQFPYHGKVESGKTLSQLASTTLSWSGDVWNFTGDYPTLK